MSELRERSISRAHPGRAVLKIAGVAATLCVGLAALLTFVSHQALNDLRHYLTLWVIIAIVAIINIVSFVLFALFYAIYRWIKRDIDPTDDD